VLARKTGMSSALLVAALLLCTVSSLALGDNLLVNPGFEASSRFWWYTMSYNGTNSTSGWTAVNMVASYSGVFDELAMSASYPGWGGGPDVQDGETALRLQAWYSVYGYGRVKVYQDVVVMPGQSYTATTWVKGVDWVPGSGFGINPTDYASLWLQQLDSAGNLLSDHPGSTVGVDKIDSAGPYTQLTKTIVTGANTRKIRFMLHAVQFCDYDKGHVTFDACALDGPPVQSTVSGNVKGDGVDLAGATVTVAETGASDVTDSAGNYSITTIGAQWTVRASKEGYSAIRKYVTANPGGTVTADFDLPSLSSNPIKNPGLEDAMTDWSVEFQVSGVQSERGLSNTAGSVVKSHSGSDALCVPFNEDASAYQVIGVQPNSEYTVSCYAAASWESGQPNGWNFSDAEANKAGLQITEFNSSGKLVNEQAMVPLTDVTGAWQQLSTTFTTTAQTAAIKIRAYGRIADYLQSWGRATYDDFAMTGPAGPAAPQLPSIYGFVRNQKTGNPISGAKVEILGTSTSTTTDANGWFAFSGLSVATHTLRASASGFYPMVVKRSVPYGHCYLKLDIQPLNLLVNAGFDENWLGGWQWGLEGSADTESWSYGLRSFDTGEEATLCTFGNGSIKQFVPVQPGANYTARCRFKGVWSYVHASEWTADPATQYGELIVQQFRANGEYFEEEHAVSASYKDWETMEVNFLTAEDTVVVAVKARAEMLDIYWNCLGRAVFDTFELEGPAGPAPTNISDAKALDDGTPVTLLHQVVYAILPDGSFYIEDPERTSGIRVVGHYMWDGSVVPIYTSVFGVLSTLNGERVIDCSAGYVEDCPAAGRVTGLPSSLVRIDPLGLSIQNAMSQTGLSSVGLRTTTWGRIVSVQKNELDEVISFVMSDGSSRDMTVYYAPSGSQYVPTADDYVVVIGPLGAEIVSDELLSVVRAPKVVKAD